MHRSWLTQRFANYLPVWTVARSRDHSLFQQFVNPIAEGTEKVFKLVSKIKKNKYISTFDAQTPAWVYRLDLPNDFTFGIDEYQLSANAALAPTCKGYIGSSSFWLEPVIENNLEALFNELPTRVEYLKAKIEYQQVLAPTFLKNVTDSLINDIYWPNKLHITIQNASRFYNRNDEYAIAFIMLHGTTIGGEEISEKILIPYNGTFISKYIYKKLSSIEYNNIANDSKAIIEIDAIPFSLDMYKDEYQLMINDETEKFLFFELTSTDFSGSVASVLEAKVFAADDMETLLNGDKNMDTIYQYELLYNNTNLQLIDIAVNPADGYIYAIDNNYLYIFGNKHPVEDLSFLSQRTPGAALKIECSDRNTLRDSTITLSPNWVLPSKSPYQFRWRVKKPDGTFVYLDENGVESASGDAWIVNTGGTSNVFGPTTTGDSNTYNKQIEYQLTQRGIYFIILESTYSHGEKQYDIVPVFVGHKEAMTRLPLPAEVRASTNIAFDSDSQLWFLRASDYIYDPSSSGPYAFRTHLACDKFIVDFERKVLYFKELYDKVDVTEPDNAVNEI